MLGDDLNSLIMGDLTLEQHIDIRVGEGVDVGEHPVDDQFGGVDGMGVGGDHEGLSGIGVGGIMSKMKTSHYREEDEVGEYTYMYIYEYTITHTTCLINLCDSSYMYRQTSSQKQSNQHSHNKHHHQRRLVFASLINQPS